MSRDSKLPKTNCLLPSVNYKHFISLIILGLVTATTAQSPSAKYLCPSGCECNETTFSARCNDLDALISSYSQSQHKSRQNDVDYMPIKSLDLSNNKLKKLTSHLELLTDLVELNLSHNQLTQVHKLNFDHLEKLDLSHNRITSAKLKKLPKNVIHLNLAHNEITFLPVDFMKLKKLKSLELVGNPLNCTCNTLHVRNWITYNHVWSDNHILCASPAFVKGQPWLQARQNDVCIEPSSTTTQASKYKWENYEDDNEIMQGDEPAADDDIVYDDEEPADEEEKNEDPPTEDEPAEDPQDEGKDVFGEEKPEEKEEEEKPEDDTKTEDEEEFMPVSPHHETSSVEPEAVSKQVTPLEDDEEEGSGADVPVTSELPEEETDESGSGGVILHIPNGDELEISNEDDTTPGSLGIFEDHSVVPIGGQSGQMTMTKAEVQNEVAPSVADGDVNKASQDDNTGTYILLGILALCLISLMVFVAMKNRKEKRRNRRFDVEKNGATELQDMDKRLLGKPLDKNGNGNGKAEHAPLMNDHPAHKDERPFTSFKPPPSITVEEPKAAPRSHPNLNENNLPNGNGHVEPVHQNPSNGSIPKSPDSDDEIFHPASEDPQSLNISPETPKRYSPIYNNASPRSERYSPVYSPETGRVKIKLTETPKPKTPVVVTRSRSRAGDYVNTPN